ncbi:MAG: hypothetical protein R3B13_37350 [Polyangiaceae bacterium]
MTNRFAPRPNYLQHSTGQLDEHCSRCAYVPHTIAQVNGAELPQWSQSLIDVRGSPDPRTVIDSLETIGETLYETRAAYMSDAERGFTKAYNELNDPTDDAPRIVELRHPHEAIDRAVLDPHSWTDIAVPPGCPIAEADHAASQRFEHEVVDRDYVLNADRVREEGHLGLRGRTRRESQWRRAGREVARGELRFGEAHAMRSPRAKERSRVNRAGRPSAGLSWLRATLFSALALALAYGSTRCSAVLPKPFPGRVSGWATRFGDASTRIADAEAAARAKFIAGRESWHLCRNRFFNGLQIAPKKTSVDRAIFIGD